MRTLTVDPSAALAAFDEQIRRSRVAEPGQVVEDDGRVVRRIADDGGWSGVTWSSLPFDAEADDVDAVIADQVRRFADVSGPWEWKHYSYDGPADLPSRLQAAGFVAEAPETLLVAEVGELALDVPPPPGVVLQPVKDAQGVADVVAVHDAVFGGDHRRIGKELLDALGSHPATVLATVAIADDRPVSAGRLELRPGTEFASIWGGGTLPEWRRRGVFRALVAARARQAAESGFRYLQVDASSQSRPILERLGFMALATTTPYLHPGGFRGTSA